MPALRTCGAALGLLLVASSAAAQTVPDAPPAAPAAPTSGAPGSPEVAAHARLGPLGPVGSNLGFVSGGMGPGIRLGEDALLHAGLLTEAGYDNNVFYADGTNQVREDSGLVRITPSVLVTNAERDGSVPSLLLYTAGASVLIRQYLNGAESANAVNPAASLTLSLSPGHTFGFSVSDTVSRTEDPPYATASRKSIDRLFNTASAQLRFAPGGGRFQGLFRYTNNLEIYEDQFEVSSNMAHDAMVDVSWKWLPKTALYAQVHQGYVTYLDAAATHAKSFPFRASAGLRGLLTPKLSLNVGAGYGMGLYEAGPTPRTITGNIELAYKPQVTTGVVLGYGHDFRDSPLVGSFYNVDGVNLVLRQILLSRLIFSATGRYEFRRYQGPGPMLAMADRHDHMLAGGVVLEFAVKEWINVGVGYSLASNQSGAAVPTSAGPDYVKHQILGRISIQY